MKYSNMTKNYIFREYECGLTIDETANLCFKSVRCVNGWDKGNEIPRECKRLMRLIKGRELSHCPCWDQFEMRNDRMLLPTGQLVTAQQIFTGIALLEIEAAHDIKTLSKLLKYARAINQI